MRRAIVPVTAAAVLAVLVAILYAAYAYYYTCDQWTCNFQSSSDWTLNGNWPDGMAFNGNSAAISTRAVPDGSSEYEVKTPVTISDSSSVYVHFLRASSDAFLDYRWFCSGSFSG